jgi:hypothetical protein
MSFSTIYVAHPRWSWEARNHKEDTMIAQSIGHETRLSRSALQLGFWSALLSVMTFVVYIVCFVAILVVNPLFIWTNFTDYVAYLQDHYTIWPDLARLMMLLFAALFVVLLNVIYEYAHTEQRILARIGLSFGLAYAILAATYYFVQISAVRINLLAGTFDGLVQVVQANPYSALSAMNMLGWTLFLGMASLFVAPIFSGGRLETLIRYAFLANGVICLLGGMAYGLDITWLVFLTINLGMGGSLMTATVALMLLFKALRARNV